MNVGVNNNLNISPSKQNSKKRVGEDKLNTFQESLIDSFNASNENKVSGKSISKIDGIELSFINDDNLNSDDLENLKVLIYFLNLVCEQNNINDKISNSENKDQTLNLLLENKLDNGLIKKNINQNMVNVKNEDFNKNSKIVSSENDFILDKIDSKFVIEFLSDLGLDTNEIEVKDINKVELYKNIINNSENFKNIIKKEVSKFDNNIPQLLDSVNNFLDDEELLKNITNEIKAKINKAVSKNKDNSDVDIVSEEFNNQNQKINSVKYEKINILNKFSGEKSDDNEILKKISGENNFDKDVESYFMDNLKNNDILNEIPVKTIDFKSPEKFIKDFIETIKYMVKDNKAEMIVKINPDHLGKMDIKYEFVKDTVRVMIRVESSEALKLMENKIVDIKEIIRDNNQINLSNINVELKQFDFNSNSHGSKHGGGKNNNKNKNSIKLEDEVIVKEKSDLSSGILV